MFYEKRYLLLSSLVPVEIILHNWGDGSKWEFFSKSDLKMVFLTENSQNQRGHDPLTLPDSSAILQCSGVRGRKVYVLKLAIIRGAKGRFIYLIL